MAEGYNIKIGVDSRSASRGVKTFTADLNNSLKALRDFDSKAKSAFKALDQFSKINGSGLQRSMKSIATAVSQLNGIKINRALLNNLQTLQKTLSGIRFSGASSLGKLPGALKALESIRVNPVIVSTLNQLKAALKGFSGPPKSLSGWGTAFHGLDKIKIPAGLAQKVEALKMAVKGFVGPAKSAWNLPNLLRQLGRTNISPTLASNLAMLKTAVAGFNGPSAKAGANLHALIQSMAGANPGQIAAVAAALQKINGLSLHVGRGLGNINKQGKNAFAGFNSGSKSAIGNLRGFTNQMSLAYHTSTLLRTALGGLTVGTAVKGISDAGNSMNGLRKAMSAVSTSSEEYNENIDFIYKLTSELPVPFEAAVKGFRGFAAAARLGGQSAETTRGVFADLSKAFVGLGLSAQDQELAFYGVQQMFSKGQVMMQELKLQVGERVPGAMELFAQSMGKTMPEFMKMIELGQVGSSNIAGWAKLMADVFSGVIPQSLMTSQANLIQLNSEFEKLKIVIFDSGFDTGLAAMAKQMAEAFKTPEVQAFAQKLGAAMGKVFQFIGALTTVLVKNGDTVLWWLGLFAGWTALGAAALMVRSLALPFMILTPLMSLSGKAIQGFGNALVLLGAGKGLAALKTITQSINILAKRFMALAGAALVALATIDAVFNNGKTVEGFANMVTALGAKMGRVMKDMAGGLFDDIPGELGAAMEESNKIFEDFSNIKFENQDMSNSAKEREIKQQEALAKALGKEAQDLYEKINPIQEANSEYEKQLALLAEISAKKGVPVADLKKVLDAQTLEDRNPMAALAQGYKIELDGLKAKTGEQKAVNAAKAVELDMLKKGIILNRAQVDAIADYHKGIAMMNGELGNGIERWTTTVGDFNDNVQEAIKDGIGGLSDEITNFVTGAETDFAGLARSILKTFVKISLDSLLKDMFGAMGMDGEKNGASMAESALAKIASIGDTINTAQTNVYTSGLSINGQPVGSMGTSPELGGAREAASRAAAAGVKEADKITRQPLADIPGTTVAPIATKEASDVALTKKVSDNMETSTKALEKHTTEMQKYVVPAGGGAPPSAYERHGLNPAGTAYPGANTTAKTGRLGAPSFPSAERFGYGVDNMPVSALRPTSEPFDLPVGGSARWGDSSAAMPKIDMSPINAAVARNAAGAVDNAATFLGHKEASPGTINSFMQSQGVDINAAQTAWCAGFVNSNLEAVGIKGNGSLVANSFLDFGKGVDPMEAMKGDVLVQHRNKGLDNTGGHVGFATGNSRMTAEGQHQLEMLSGNTSGPGLGRGGVGYDWINSKELAVRRPPEMSGMQATSGIDPMATSGIDAFNAKLTATGAAAQAAVPQVDIMKTKLTETGTTASTAGQQTQMANQTKTMSEQQAAMGTQMAGQQVQMAGTQAQMAGPQFTSAGSSIQQAGQMAQQGGSAAQAAAPQVGGFGQGIMGLLGPLASAIPGLGQFGGMIMQLLSSLMGGGGGMGGGLFKEGGLSGSPVATTRLPAGAWAGAPHYADGIANTSGGMPAVLHPNEAVIPLSRGRKVPVEMDGPDEPRQENLDKRARPTMVFNISGVKDADSFKRSKSQIATSMASMQHRAMMRNG